MLTSVNVRLLRPCVRTSRHRVAGWVAIVAVALGLSAAPGARVRYGAFNLGALPGMGAESRAWGINDRGDVVGSTLLDGQWQAFLWTSTDGLRLLDPPEGGVSSWANAVNDARQVVGSWRNAAGIEHAFVWTETAGMIDLGTSNGLTSEAVAINAAGHVVGSRRVADGSLRAFRWTPIEGMVDLGSPGGRDSVAIGINDDGVVTCNLIEPGVAWSSEGLPTSTPCFSVGNELVPLLVAAPSSPASARAINNAGQIVGLSTASDLAAGGWPADAVVWPAPTANRVAARFDSVGPVRLIHDINDVGQVLAEDEQSVTFIWSPSEGRFDLPDGISARRINDRGEVVGFRAVGSRARAMLWRPIVSPVTSLSLTADPMSAQPPGTAITLATTSTGGTEPISYRFWLQPWGDERRLLRDWSVAATHTWTPTTEGGYSVWAESVSDGGFEVEAQTGINFEIKPGAAVAAPGSLVLTLSPSAASPQPPGTWVVWTASAAGVAMPYEYRFWVQSWNGVWELARDWNELSVFEWQPTAGGGYNIGVEARSLGAPAAEERTLQNFIVTVP